MRSINVLAAVMLLSLIGCASGTSLRPTEAGGLEPPALDVPWPADPPHHTSYATPRIVNGDSSYWESAGATPMAPQMQLPAGPDVAEYAVYWLRTSGNPLLSVEVELEVSAGEGCWIGLPDYDRGVWQFSGPYATGTAIFDTPSPSWVSPQNNLYVAVVAHDETTVLVTTVSATIDIPIWHSHVVDTDSMCGEDSSLAIMDGRPMIAYSDFLSEELCFARSTVAVPTESTDWVTMTVDPVT